jgi:hypothetical protein
MNAFDGFVITVSRFLLQFDQLVVAKDDVPSDHPIARHDNLLVTNLQRRLL